MHAERIPKPQIGVVYVECSNLSKITQNCRNTCAAIKVNGVWQLSLVYFLCPFNGTVGCYIMKGGCMFMEGYYGPTFCTFPSSYMWRQISEHFHEYRILNLDDLSLIWLNQINGKLCGNRVVSSNTLNHVDNMLQSCGYGPDLMLHCKLPMVKILPSIGARLPSILTSNFCCYPQNEKRCFKGRKQEEYKLLPRWLKNKGNHLII